MHNVHPRPDKTLICLTGGGTAGHVTPHFAWTPFFDKQGWDYIYIGSQGLEKSLVEAQKIPFYTIAAGKLRRYASWQNFTDLFKVVGGFFQAFRILGQTRPSLILSKGGFVAVPVAVAGWLRKIPVISHESDVSPGLANRIIARFAHKILYAFPETAQYISGDKGVYVGAPVRADLALGDKNRAVALCGFQDFDPSLPTLLVMGGSQGAQRINDALKIILPTLTQSMQVIHLTGKGKTIGFQHPRYKAFEFVSQEFKDLLALSTHVVSRAGSNSIFELLELHKPMLLIPLELGSRGDQILNANSFARQGWCLTLRDKDLSETSLLAAIKQLIDQGPQLVLKHQSRPTSHTCDRVVDEIKSTLKI